MIGIVAFLVEVTRLAALCSMRGDLALTSDALIFGSLTAKNEGQSTLWTFGLQNSLDRRGFPLASGKLFQLEKAYESGGNTVLTKKKPSSQTGKALSLQASVHPLVQSGQFD